MGLYDYFELHRGVDGLVYRFDRALRADGRAGYKRRDLDVWIIRDPGFGWVSVAEGPHAITGVAWGLLPQDQPDDHPPAGVWVSRKGIKSYVYELRYDVAPLY